MLRRGLLLGGLVLGSLAVAGSASPRPPTNHVVTITGMDFGRIPADLKVGDTITWVNRDTVPHTVTARNRSFDLRLGAGQSKRMVLQKAGSIPIYCIYHPPMRGKLEVAAN
jgi:plastocyanin